MAGGVRAAHRIAFVLVENFTMAPFTLAVDTLRLANYVSGRELFGWRVHSVDGHTTRSSSGIRVEVDAGLFELDAREDVFVCAGIGVEGMDHGALIARLRDLAARGATLGAMCVGTFVLADAGLLEGHRCTTHWEYIAGLRERHPDLEITEELFEVDRKRATCAGGTAAIDLMLDLISRHEGPDLAAAVTDELIHHRMRGPRERQRLAGRGRPRIANPHVAGVVEQMEKHLEDTLSCTQLARQAGLSARQMERLFARCLGVSPARHYLNLRLERGRQLLRQTNLPVLQVALACGFATASHFSKSYSDLFGMPPSEERAQAPRARKWFDSDARSASAG